MTDDFTASVEALMKRCQNGVGGRNALDQAHEIMAECYGTLGKLLLEVQAQRGRCAEIARGEDHRSEAMTERELLEKAAKAAGLPAFWDELPGQMRVTTDTGQWYLWRPLDDDGDALRLLAALPTLWTLRMMFHEVVSLSMAFGTGAGIEATQATHDLGRAWALRRAIVRAAAAMPTDQAAPIDKIK